MISRREVLALGGTVLAGGTITIRAWDPPHFDPVLTFSYKTHEIQRHLARQQYYVYMPSGIYVGARDRARKNFDYGGRLGAAWLDR